MKGLNFEQNHGIIDETVEPRNLVTHGVCISPYDVGVFEHA